MDGLAPDEATEALPTARQSHIPGEAGVWLLILGEMSFFAALFASFMYYRSFDVSGFAAGQAKLSEITAIANTMVLLTSSLFVAKAVKAADGGDTRKAPRLFAAGLLCGVGFIALKVVEYHALISQGITLNTDVFFSFYFGLTILHLVHVFAGSAMLGLLIFFTRERPATPAQFALIESAGCFWHMVDLLWIVIFALLFLVK